MTAQLFEPFALRGATIRNRIGVSPMCTYSAPGGLATPWHLTHLASRAVGGAGLVIAEAAAVAPDGRISPMDLGIWSDDQAQALQPVVAAISAAGAVPGIQLAHAGRKGSTQVPWIGRDFVPVTDGGWEVPAPSAIPFSENSAPTYAMTTAQIEITIANFAAAAARAVQCGFRFLECHFAHGYLVHEFLSPLSNQRTDTYGGSFEGRTRLALEITEAIRQAIPDDVVLSVRLSCVDWVEGGWSLEESVQLAGLLKERGVDIIDCSSGANVAGAQPPSGPEVQREFAREIRRRADVCTAAVGGITDPHEAAGIIADGTADLVLLARAMLNDPYWAIHAAIAVGAPVPSPAQYKRGIG